MVKAFKELHKELNYSIESVKLIDDLLDQEIKKGQPIPGGLFTTQFGYKCFAIRSYIGEVVIRNSKAAKLLVDDTDKDGEINISVLSANNIIIWPVQRVISRMQNGREDELFVYIAATVGDMRFDGEIPEAFFSKGIDHKKSWWRLFRS
ncbi:hypothetical protein [Chitinophaga sp. Ak27]|uniref:hypothetical protein n=1 Tax=Chitinophaga sp. Ak27 TaxID=2726116 RepID=UPI00145F3640|nr:hypothetical protein [Chitinophaga sp. Ak27]NLU91353.1 hypothetical protein [Chitinophaga sp. Ak27]